MDLKSVWQENKQHEYPALEEDIERDIVVVGGGIAGYLAAYRLTEAGCKVTLIEADRLFSGTTSRTTAKITCNQGNVYADLYNRYGKHMTSLYYQSQTDGMRGYADLVEKYNIDCNWEETDSYIYSRGCHCKPEKSFKALREIGVDCELLHEIEPLKVACALKIGKQYLFDPIRFLTALPVEFEIFEHTRAVEIDAERKVITTDKGSIKAHKIVIATHYPIINSHGGYIMKLRQSMSYTVAVRKKCVDGMYLDEREDGLSLRPYENGTLICGGDHRTGRNKSGDQFEVLEADAKKLFGAEEVTHRWCAEDCMTFDGMPLVGKYANNLDGIYVVTGFNKWGMANSMVSASLLTDLILGRENPYAEIFSPQRRMKGTFGKFIVNAAVNMAGIFLGYFRITFKTVNDIPPGRGMIVRHDGKKRAVYKDADGKLYVIGNMCPHMHCELKWNDAAKTWDCPCHGSRFDIYGKIVNEPTVKAARLEEESSKS